MITPASFRTTLVFFACCMLVQSASAQSQLAFDWLNDFGSGTTQTFVAESNASVSGIRLVVFGHGTAADISVHIRDLLSDGSLGSTTLASGTLSSVEIPTDAADWRLVAFDAPFHLSLGEDYGIVVNQFGSGPTRFNDFGASLAAPYANGDLLFELFPNQPLLHTSPNADLAFAFVSPEPSTLCLLLLTLIFQPRWCRHL